MSRSWPRWSRTALRHLLQDLVTGLENGELRLPPGGLPAAETPARPAVQGFFAYR